MSALTITSSNFASDVLQSEKPVLIDFWAAWCGPCRMLSPVVEEIADELKDDILVGKINVDEEQALAGQYGVMSIPMLILFKDGKPVKTSVGVRPKEEILQMIRQAL